MSNSVAYVELRTEAFIQSTVVESSNSVNHNWAQELSYSKYSLFIWNQDWICDA